MPSVAAADWLLCATSASTLAPSSRAAAATGSSLVTTIVRSIAGVRRERVHHVCDHRAGEREPQLVGDALAQALLGACEALDGQDAAVRIAQSVSSRAR